ncbi:MAG: nuclear transport factor 2 family protein, partial [Dehalococcoidia bacterium]|nr:nuclear transport factor 2 family protein [Dehalococcoidia bacterium]
MVATQNLEATIVGLEEERLAAMVAADVDTLDRVLADDLRYVHTTAAIDTKESLTSGLASGRLNY